VTRFVDDDVGPAVEQRPTSSEPEHPRSIATAEVFAHDRLQRAGEVMDDALVWTGRGGRVHDELGSINDLDVGDRISSGSAS